MTIGLYLIAYQATNICIPYIVFCFFYFEGHLMMELAEFGMQGIPNQLREYTSQGLMILLLVSFLLFCSIIY